MNGNNSFMPRNHMISQVFVFVLLGVFAVLSTFMVLLSAQLYRGIIYQTEVSGERRILASFVTNAVKANDAADSIYIDNRNDTEMLVISWDSEEQSYETKIYAYEGMLCELFTEASAEFNPEYGEEICKIGSFEPMIEDGILKVAMTDGNGEDINVDIALRCIQEAKDE